MKAKTTEDAFKQLTELLNRSELALKSEEPGTTKEIEHPQMKIATGTMKKFNALTALEKITKPDLEILSPEEKRTFVLYISTQLSEKKYQDRDIFIEKIDGILAPWAKEEIRENNNRKINNAIVNYFKKNGRLPGKAEIVRITGLSRTTVIKHLKEFDPTEELQATAKEQRLVKESIANSIIKAALNGDMRAAKLYMSTLHKLPGNPGQTTVLNQQNNYVHLHGVTFNLQQLPEEKLKVIEEIVKGVLVVKGE